MKRRLDRPLPNAERMSGLGMRLGIRGPIDAHTASGESSEIIDARKHIFRLVDFNCA